MKTTAHQLHEAAKELTRLQELENKLTTSYAFSVTSRVLLLKYSSDDELRLRCGELTAQEIRTIRAVLNYILP
jgi:hypothetical protein